LHKIDLGDVAAENEITGLRSYFVQTGPAVQARRGHARLVVGRKGSGDLRELSEAVREYLRSKESVWVLVDNLDKGWPVGGTTDRSQVRTGNGPRVMASLPGHHRLAPDRPNQHRRRFALPRAPARQAPANDHELLERA
jgi:hypothetical protein